MTDDQRKRMNDLFWRLGMLPPDKEESLDTGQLLRLFSVLVDSHEYLSQCIAEIRTGREVRP